MKSQSPHCSWGLGGPWLQMTSALEGERRDELVERKTGDRRVGCWLETHSR